MFTKQELIDKLKQNYDILTRDFLIAKKIPACIFMIDGMVNRQSVNRFAIQPLLLAKTLPTVSAEYVVENILEEGETGYITTMEDCVTTILNGDAVLWCEAFDKAIKIGAKGYNLRAISEPPTSVAIRGPREGFTEDMKNNSIMLRRKLKTPELIFKLIKIGKYSGTNVLVAYINGIADETIAQEVQNRLKRIDIDGVLDAYYIASFLEDNKNSIFKQIGTSEKPDIVASKLLEGRIAVIVDGSPIVLTLPFLLLEDYQNPEDYYEKPQRATFSRIIRLLAVLIAVLIPAVYVSAQVYHLQIFPLKFLTKIMGSVSQIPLPPAAEMFAVLAIFEILRESSVRMPKYVGNALAIVGGLVLGETAVRAGLISSPSILIIALSSIALYTVPDQESALTLLRALFLFVGSALGIYGVMLASLFLLVYLVSFSSFGTPYLAPFAPHVRSDLKDAFFKNGLTDMKQRPHSVQNNNPTRQR